ncbi:unnamed protein product [Arctia plantaginis]|uniref:Uncharacterized protein n=1 Tax=Arctia plantaginis TaxID=874455 RepID=A0A8S1AKU8_ARCPL|nr:unnamed protein product [Arctia plantaginis]
MPTQHIPGMPLIREAGPKALTAKKVSKDRGNRKGGIKTGLAHRPRNPRTRCRRQMFTRLEIRGGRAGHAGPKWNLVKVGQHSLKIKWMGRQNQFCESASVGNDDLGIYAETGRFDKQLATGEGEEIDH